MENKNQTSCFQTKSKNSNAKFWVKKFVVPIEPDLEISRIDFSIFSDRDIKRLSVTEIFVPEIYNNSVDPSNTFDRKINKSGPLDLRLGVSQKISQCKTCSKDLVECVGHFGHVSLPLPVYHVGFFHETVRVYQCVCKSCGKLLLTPQQKKYFTCKLMFRKEFGKTQVRKVVKEITNLCTKVSACYYCGAVNGKVMKAKNFYGIIHRRPAGSINEEIKDYKTAISLTPEIEKHLVQKTENPNPLNILNLFNVVSDEDLFLLNLGHNRPENLLITALPVPPACIRPTVIVDDSTTQEDDLTGKLREIVKISNTIKMNMNKGGISSTVRELWALLQSEVARYINSDMTGFTNIGRQNKQMRSLVQRLIGKKGRFRGNLSGKRVDFTGRTVISPDPNVEIGQVVIPLQIAKTLTYPETVNSHNIKKLRKCVINGPENYPGANFLIFKNNSMKRFLKFGDRLSVAKNLKPGDTVERHLIANDVVLFNRQPSLHRMSIMAHRVKVMEGKTFRFNLCVCNPYNADFDGDEMNIHVPQTEEARAEAAILMAVENNLITPKNGEPLVVPIQDFLTASYLLTNKSRFFEKESFMQTCCHFLDQSERISLVCPCIVKPKKLWSGKQIMTIVLSPNLNAKNPQKSHLINLEVPTGQYPRKPKDPHYPRKYLDPLDRFVLIRHSAHLSGNFDKRILGSSKNGLFAALVKSNTPASAARIMARLAKLCSHWVGQAGFSIGLDDVAPSPALTAAKKRLMDDGYARCDAFEAQFRAGGLKPQPGCTTLETLEAKMLGKLSEVRERCGRMCVESLDGFRNAPIIMATCGSKGSTINIAQMVACVGQQALQSGRIPEGFVNRTLPHFKEFSRSPEAKGFVRNSFFTGLNATEFFFHTMAGREGLIDTAVKTAETGYMQRRLMKALEDACVQYDNTVRNSENVVLQFSYGGDGLDPVNADKVNKSYMSSILRQCVGRFKNYENVERLLPNEITAAMRKKIESVKNGETWQFYNNDIWDQFESDATAVVQKKIKNIETVRRKLNLSLTKKLQNSSTEDYCDRVCGLTLNELEDFINRSFDAYHASLVEPGTAVGAIGAQSIGEPSTQMTLKTFHFAGVASMNITLGVPRIKEIVNAALTIKTPIVNAALECVGSEETARLVKGRLEITLLGEVCRHVRQVIGGESCIEVVVDRATVAKLMLKINATSVKKAILKNKKTLKLKNEDVAIISDYKLKIFSPETNRDKLLFSLERIALLLPKVQVNGIGSIHRAVIRHPDPIKFRWEYRLKSETRTKALKAKQSAAVEESFLRKEARAAVEMAPRVWLRIDFSADDGAWPREGGEFSAAIENQKNGLCFDVLVKRVKIEFELTVEGTDFLKVITTMGVDGLNTTTNFVPVVEKSLGIEAARESIVRELNFTFSVHGLEVDMRHIRLLADLMTFKGSVLGITRFGIAKMKESVLMQASFETPMVHLLAAAAEAASDPVRGVSECIILGKTMPIGTGVFKLMRKVEAFEAEDRKESIFGADLD